jgi:hypothetical protein
MKYQSLRCRIIPDLVSCVQRWITYPFHFAAEIDDLNSIIRQLDGIYTTNNPNRHKQDIDAVDGNGYTCLHIAVTFGHVAIVVYLLQRGANSTRRPALSTELFRIRSGPNGNTILHHAIESSSPTVESLLVTVYVILRAFPKAAARHNNAHKLPIALLLEKYANIPLFEPNVIVDAVIMLLEAHPLSHDEVNAICSAVYGGAQKKSDMVTNNRQALLLLSKCLASSESDSIQSIPLHICGDSFSGKTTFRSALYFAISPPTNSFLGIDYGANVPKNIYLDAGEEGRTLGVDVEVLSKNKRHWIVHDYGGCHRLHVDHLRLLSSPQSIYVVMVPLFNIRSKKLYDKAEIIDRYTYWLQFLHSIARERDHSRFSIITVINFGQYGGSERSTSIKKALVSRQNWWLDEKCSHHGGHLDELAFISTIVIDASICRLSSRPQRISMRKYKEDYMTPPEKATVLS